jgi:short-subunit dehydrogenase
MSFAGPLLDVPMAEAQKLVETNFFGLVRLVNEVVPRMAKRQVAPGAPRGKASSYRISFQITQSCNVGTIVAISSILGELATPFRGFYNASKAMLRSYTETLQMECSVDTVRVNVSPYFLLTVNLRYHYPSKQVTLISPGSVKSNFSANSAKRYQSPSDSLYKAWEKHIMHIMVQAQLPASNPMPTEKFADVVVKALVTPKGNPYLHSKFQILS